MKKLTGLLLGIALVFVSIVSAKANDFTDLSRGGGKGWLHYVDIVVEWDGNPSHAGSWNVYAINVDGDDIGEWIAGCTGGGVPDSCLNMSSYNFEFKGKTLQFDETYVSGVTAYPQTHHVVLHDDGKGVYTGRNTARYDFPTRPGRIFMDVMDYEVKTDESGNITEFKYIEHEFYRYIEIEE